MNLSSIKTRVAEIQVHSLAVAKAHPTSSDLNELGFAIANLAEMVKELAEEANLRRPQG